MLVIVDWKQDNIDRSVPIWDFSRDDDAEVLHQHVLSQIEFAFRVRFPLRF
jgi:hypothetical protein